MKRGSIIFSVLVLICIFTIVRVMVNINHSKNEKVIDATVLTCATDEEASDAPMFLETKTDEEQVAPITWEATASGDGMLKYTITGVHITTNSQNIEDTCFLAESSVYVGNMDSYAEYCYPTFIGTDGEFINGIYMVLLDVTVNNPDGATNRYQDANGKWINHYDNPYIFSAVGIGKLLDLGEILDVETQRCMSYRVAYFSNKNSCAEREDGFELRSGESISFQIGYLIGSRGDGSPVDCSDLVFGLSNSLKLFWEDLHL